MLEVPKMQTNKLSNSKWINRHIVSSYKITQQFRNAKGATNPSLFFSPVLWSLLEHQGFLGHFLHWQEEKKKKRTIPEESSKIIKENWTKTCNEEWGKNCITGGKLLLWETKTRSSVLDINISRYSETPRKANASAKTKLLPGAK